MNTIHRERYIWLFFLIAGVLAWKVVIPTQVETSQNYPNYGPEFFPNLLVITIIIISAISFIGTFIKKMNQPEKNNVEESEEKGNVWIGLAVFLITVIYVFMMDYIAFIPSSIVCMVLIMWLLSVRKWYLYLIMIAIILILNYLFENIMYIQLP